MGKRQIGPVERATPPPIYIPAGMPEPPCNLSDTVPYLVLQIYEGIQVGREDATGWVSLNATRLKKTFSNSKKGITWLTENGIIEVTGSYQPGAKPKGYRFVGEPLFNSVTPSLKLIQKIREDQERYPDRMDPVHRHLKQWLTHTEFDLERARGMACANEKRLRQGIAIHNNRFAFKRSDYGRVYTSVTSLKKELQSCLSIHGESLTSIDIKNVQPLILCTLFPGFKGVVGKGGITKAKPKLNTDTGSTQVKHEDNTTLYVVDLSPSAIPYASNGTFTDVASCTFPPDAQQYFADTQGGVVYDALMIEVGVPPDDRDKFKKQIFKRIFYGAKGLKRKRYRGKFKGWRGTLAEWKAYKGEPLTRRQKGKRRREYKVVKAFAAKYPTAYALIQSQKERNYRLFSRRMQRMESDLMIEGVCGRLMREYPHIPILTIHDAILTTPSHVETVSRIIRETFQAQGLTPTLTTTDLNRD